MFAANCDDLLPSAVTGHQRLISSADLVRVRETGWGDGDPGAPPPMSVSPDGKRFAVVLRRGDPETNVTCVGLAVIELASGRARLLDVSQTMLRDRAPWNGLLGMPSGRPLFNQPHWSPDGGSVFYLRSTKDQPQVWRVDLAGSPTVKITHAVDGVIHFGLSSDGQRIIYSSRAGLAAAREKLIAEGRRGWVYDNRFAPIYGREPYVSGVPASAFSIGIGATGERPATAEEINESGVRLGEVSDALELQPPDRDWRVSPVLVRSDRPFGPSRLSVSYQGHPLKCPDRVCAGKVYAAIPVGPMLAVLREADRHPGDLNLIVWRPGHVARVLRSGSDVLSGCVAGADALICLEEGATRPPRIVRVALSGRGAGQLQLLLDLNPEFDHLILGRVRRLYWTDANGIAAYGDLTLPPDHHPGDRHPLIIVQYQSCGFLRGGSGNEYPIHPLAARGYAVLSINQPRHAIAKKGADAVDMNAFQAKMYENLWQRRALLAALDAGIDAALASATVDPDHIGLTGMSDGVMTAAFALIQHPRYRAAAMGAGWLDPVSYTSVVGPLFSDMVASWGLPAAEADPKLWRQVSLARNADRVKIPILVQTGDAELRVGLEGYEALRRAKRPIELIVYPDEYHNKWQPAHLLAMYESCIEWFDFWLKGVPPSDPERAKRWAALAAQSVAADQPAQ
nr:Atxe2 family lasso peptide isopeptidase [Sphingomonas sp. ID1715]